MEAIAHALTAIETGLVARNGLCFVAFPPSERESAFAGASKSLGVVYWADGVAIFLALAVGGLTAGRILQLGRVGFAVGSLDDSKHRAQVYGAVGTKAMHVDKHPADEIEGFYLISLSENRGPTHSSRLTWIWVCTSVGMVESRSLESQFSHR